MDTELQGEALAAHLAAHWKAILESEPHELRIGELVARQLPLMARALGAPHITFPFHIRGFESMRKPVDDPETHQVTGMWTMHWDEAEGVPWACGMVAIGRNAIREAYIDVGRENLFHDAFLWAQSGVHEKVQSNFRLELHHLSKIKKLAGIETRVYDLALGAHLTLELAWEHRLESSDDLAERYAHLAPQYKIETSWNTARAIALDARRIIVPAPCQSIPMEVIRGRGPDIPIAEAIWQYLADPANNFGLSLRAAAHEIQAPYSSLSSRRTNRIKRQQLQSARKAPSGAQTNPSPAKLGKGGE